MDKNKLIQGITLEDIYEFIDNGDPDNAPEGIDLYLDLMDKVRSLDQRAADYGTKASVLNHLMKYEGLTRHLATKVYYDGLEYFYASEQLSKKAQRNVYADKADRVVAMVLPFIKNIDDAKKVVGMIKDAFYMRQLDKEEQKIIPEEWYKKTYNLYVTDPLEAGMSPINKKELAQQIDNYPELTPKEKEWLKREALIEPLILFPDDTQNPRKEK